MRFPLRTKAELEQDPSKERTIDLTLSDDQLLPFARFLLRKLAGLEVRHKRGSAIHLEDSEVTTISVLGTIKLEDKDDVPHIMIFDFDDEVEEVEEDEEDEEEDEPRNLICNSCGTPLVTNRKQVASYTCFDGRRLCVACLFFDEVAHDEQALRELVKAFKHMKRALDTVSHDPFMAGRIFAAMNTLERVITDDGEGGLAIEDMLDCGVCEPPRPTNWVCSVCGKSITTNLRNMTCETCNGRPPGM